VRQYLWTSAANGTFVNPPDDTGENVKHRWNYADRGNNWTGIKFCPSAILSTTNPTLTALETGPGRRGEKLTTNRLATRCITSPCSHWMPGSLVSSVWLRTGRQGDRGRSPAGACSSDLGVHTGSGAHPASCTMGTGVFSPGLKRSWGVTLTTHSHLVPRSRVRRSYMFSLPKRLHGM
jgi:hypothetical protein